MTAHFPDLYMHLNKKVEDNVRSDSYLHVLRLLIESEGRFRTKYDDNTDDSNFPIVNFSFIRSNIPSAHGFYH
jgi:hypothetical protein